MKYPREEGSAVFKDAMSENRSVQNLSDPAHGKVMKLNGASITNKPAPKPQTGPAL